MRLPVVVLLLVGVVGVAQGSDPVPPKTSIDPLDCRWTFGNHEPIAMYRRAGGPTTGGIEGGAQWLPEWHHWFDSEACTQRMQDLGLNCRCRFYKGMGWQYESQDFPSRRFVENAWRGIRVLAYIQFSTLYQEVAERDSRPGRLGRPGRTWPETHLARRVLPLGPCSNHPDFGDI